MVDIGDAKLKVTADTTAAEGKLKAFGNSAEKMSGRFRKMGIAMVAVGLAIAGAMVKMTMEYAKAGDEIAKMSKRTGIATETLSKWKYMADLSGTSLQAMEKGYKKLAMSIDDAKDGLETYTREFEKIGINIQELEGLSPEEQFMKIATAVAAIEDPMQRAALAQSLFGRAGMELLPMLEGGADGLRELSQLASENATIFDAEAAVAAEKFNDSITTLKTSLMKMGASIAEEVMPDLLIFVEKVTEIVKKVGEWIEANPILVGGLKLLVGILVGGGGLLIAFSMISKAIIAINMALAIMHGLMGPAGWAKMAAGLAIAGGTIFAMSKLMGEETQVAIKASPFTPEEQARLNAMMEKAGRPELKLPEMQRGGIVTRPTALIAGERGPEAIIPLGRGQGSTYNITLQSEAFMGNEAEALSFSERILENIRLLEERTTGVSA